MRARDEWRKVIMTQVGPAAVKPKKGKDQSVGRGRPLNRSSGSAMKHSGSDKPTSARRRDGSHSRTDSKESQHAKDACIEEDSESGEFDDDPAVDPDELVFVDATAPRSSLKFDKEIGKLPPGSALLVRHLMPSGKVDVDAFYYLDARVAQKDGLLCECTFLGASGQAHSDLQNIRRGSGRLLHLCMTASGCPSLWNRSAVIHAMVWRRLRADEFDSVPWTP